MLTEKDINNQIKDLIANGKLQAAEHVVNYTRDVDSLCILIGAILDTKEYDKADELAVRHNIVQEVATQCGMVKRIEAIIEEKNFELAYKTASNFEVIDEETIINGLVSIVVEMSAASIFSVKASVKNEKINTAFNNRLLEEGIGEIVEFGSYHGETVKWRVLDKMGDKRLLISEQAIDCKKYHSKYEDITWEKCTLRKWLNDDFIKEAFSEEEQKRIDTTNVCNKDNERYNTTGGNDTEDKVFLLSIEEAYKYFEDDNDRICKAYAEKTGADTRSDGSCWWWLRSPGKYSDFAAIVFSYGDVHELGYCVSDDDLAVRPAFWLNP